MAALTSKKVKITSWTEYILTHYRGVFCLLFLLPLSAVFEGYLWCVVHPRDRRRRRPRSPSTTPPRSFGAVRTRRVA